MDTSIIPVIKQLEELFAILNDKFYDGELPTPVIQASTTGKKKAYGWCTTYKAWTNSTIYDISSPSDQLTEAEKKIISQEDGYFEINICAEYLNRSFEDICETMLHEMVHLYCKIHDIKDTTQSGTYHNKRYKDAAECHGLEVARSKYGWSETSLKYEAIEFLNTLDKKHFTLHRRDPKPTEKKKAKQSLRKYMCVGCGCIIRASHEVKVICSECNQLFLLVVKNEETGEETAVTDQDRIENNTELPVPDISTNDQLPNEAPDTKEEGQEDTPFAPVTSTLSIEENNEIIEESEKQAS